MAMYHIQPAPILCVNDETGSWVMTHNITRVMATKDGGSHVFVRVDRSNGTINTASCIESPYSPEELRKRLFEG